MNEGSANPTEATGLGLVPSAGAVNRKVLTPPGTFIWPEKPRLGGASSEITWPRVLNHVETRGLQG